MKLFAILCSCTIVLVIMLVLDGLIKRGHDPYFILLALLLTSTLVSLVWKDDKL